MNKKLILNKETIAQLTNPDRVFGGEGGAGPVPPTVQGATCVGATCDGQYTCPQHDPLVDRCTPEPPING